MITKLTNITLFVNNQDEALKFYTTILGFIVHTDAIYGDFRWLTICLKNQPDLEIALMPATTPEEKALIGKQAGKIPFLALQSDDCLKDYESLKAKGVTFIEEPKKESWGIAVACKDLYGNLLYIVQPIS